MQGQILFVEFGHKVADGSEGGQIQVQVFYLAFAAAPSGHKIEFGFSSARWVVSYRAIDGCMPCNAELYTANTAYAKPFLSLRVANITCAPHETSALMIS